MNPTTNFNVYKSSAGSGKTHNLVKEYLHLVIDNPQNYRHILAITFTNKAANELKSRILTYLGRLSSVPVDRDNSLISDILDDLAASGFSEQTVTRHAAMALDLILHNYSGFAVGTIDSFVHHIVRSFVRDLHLPPNFEVELDDDKLLAKAIDLLISKAGTDKYLTDILVQFIESKMDDEKSWNIDKELKEFAKSLLKEDGIRSIQQLRQLQTNDFITIRQKLVSVTTNFENSIVRIANEALGRIRNKGIETSSFFQSNKGIVSFFEKVAGLKKDFHHINTYVTTTITENRWHSGKCSPADRHRIDEISGALTDDFNQITALFEAELPTYKLYQIILRNLFPVALLNAIATVIDEFRENENIVHISEFNKRISTIIGNEAVPFIYERIGEKYRHFLIDEFQDTSLLQWQNMLPLIENSLGNDHFNMIVGDGKQAIYRWRNGEVEQFAQLPHIYAPGNEEVASRYTPMMKNHYTEHVLDTNYRSASEIVEFNNRFFWFARQFLPEDLKNIYHEVEQKNTGNNTGGLIEVEFFPKEGVTKEEKNKIHLERVRQIIVEDLAGRPLSDIAVLTRKNSDASLVAEYLLQQGISVISSELLDLSASAGVNFLNAFLAHLHNPTDKIAIATILAYLTDHKLISLSLSQVLELCSEPRKEVNPGLQTMSLASIINENGIRLEIKNFDVLTLYETTEELVNIFNLDPGNKNPFIQFFLDLVLEFSKTQNEGIPDFLAWWDDTKGKHPIIVPDGIDAIRIMTIHKAKGLEFPVVIYPFANERSRLSLNKVWVDLDLKVEPRLKTMLLNNSSALSETGFADVYEKEVGKSFLDTLNLLYVAMTRPTQQLYILTDDKRKDGDWKNDTLFPDNADLLHEFLSDKGIWDDNRSRYFFGEKTLPGSVTIPQKYATDSAQKKTPGQANWRNRIHISRMAPTAWDVENPGKSRTWGNLVHAMMASVITADDIPGTIRRFIMMGLVDESEETTLAGKLHRIVELPEIKDFYKQGPEIRTEPDILLPDGSRLRPDRLVITGTKAVIIDYKTGHEDDYHARQLAGYERILREMGFHDFEKYLVYVDEEKVKRV